MSGTNSFFKFGIPLVAFIVGGSFFLGKFVEGQVEKRDKRVRSRTVKQFDLEEEHKRAMAALADNESYEMKRIARPEEQNK
mmetsp:Transcript_6980/g.10523  ORF Transcript_6980/g.10523 Transcript_6980/m.10523 type:complete len:81 (+) Transcript_6980:55-297(+)